MLACAVGIEGFTLPCGFIVKELAIYYTNNEFDHFLFERPHDVQLSYRDLSTIRYITEELNALSYEDGLIPYSQMQPILGKLLGYTINTYGIDAKKCLLKCVPTSVIINTQDIGQKISKILPNPKCFRDHGNQEHGYRYCGKAKVIAIKQFMENEQ